MEEPFDIAMLILLWLLTVVAEADVLEVGNKILWKPSIVIVERLALRTVHSGYCIPYSRLFGVQLAQGSHSIQTARLHTSHSKERRSVHLVDI